MEDKIIGHINGHDVVIAHKPHDGKTLVYLCLQNKETGERGWPKAFGQPHGFACDSKDEKLISMATENLIGTWSKIMNAINLAQVLQHL